MSRLWKLSPCPGPTDRRAMLKVGALTGLGLTLGDYFRARAGEPAGKAAKAQACIHIFLPGGMAHQESFDPKPLAPPEYRGPLGAIKTNVDGIQFG